MTATIDCHTTADEIEKADCVMSHELTDKVCVLVLGMHRSGTSLLGGLLEQLGCRGPQNKLGPSQWNPKGYFESPEVIQLNDNILDALGSRWDDWGPLHPGWHESPRFNEFRARIGEVMAAEYGDASMVYLKDPRICRLLPLWREALEDAGYAPVCIHTHRNPADVTRSLQLRGSAQVEPGFGMLLWLRHVLDAEAASRGLPRIFTSYGRILSNWTEFSDRAEQTFGFCWPVMRQARETRVQEILDPALRHHDTPASAYLANTSAPDLVRDCLRILEAWAEKSEDEEGREALTLIRERFDASGALFARPLAEFSKHAQRARTLEAKLAAVQEGGKVHEAEAARLRNDLKTHRHEAEETRRSLAAEVQELTTRLTDRKAEAEQLEEARVSLKQMHARVEVLESERDSLIEREATLRKNLVDANDGLAAARTEADTQQARLQSELDAFADKIIERDKAAVALRKELDQAKSNAAGARAEAETRQADLRTEAANLRKEVARLQRELDAFADKFTNQEKVVLSLEKEMTARERAADLHRERVASAYAAEMEKLNHAYRSSASWRYSAPLRAVGRLFKGRRQEIANRG